jgi:hypothetical protein
VNSPNGRSFVVNSPNGRSVFFSKKKRYDACTKKMLKIQHVNSCRLVSLIGSGREQVLLCPTSFVLFLHSEELLSTSVEEVLSVRHKELNHEGSNSALTGRII